MPAFARNFRLRLARYARAHRPFKGRHRMLRAADRLLRQIDSRSLEAEVSGVVFRLDTEDLIDFNLLYRGLHQSDLVTYLSRRLSLGPAVVWDVGANVGSISLPLLRRHSDIIVHAFEPSPPVFARLTRNVACNPALKSRIHLHHLALARETGTAGFFVSNEPFNSGVGGLKRAHNRATSSVEIVVARGDDLLTTGRVPRPSVIKIDVEGFELEVLMGLSRFLATSQDVELIFEHEPYRLRERQMDLRAVVAHLERLNFTVHRIDVPEDGRTAPLTPECLECSCDLVARKIA